MILQDLSTCAVCSQPLTEPIKLGQMIAHKKCAEYVMLVTRETAQRATRMAQKNIEDGRTIVTDEERAVIEAAKEFANATLANWDDMLMELQSATDALIESEKPDPWDLLMRIRTAKEFPTDELLKDLEYAIDWKLAQDV